MTADCTYLIRSANPRLSTLLAGVSLAKGDKADWAAMAPLHYRSHALAGLDRLWTLRHSGDLIGIIAYCYPPANLAGRNRALAELTGRLPARGRLRFWNQHLRTISRVVIDPNWRGLGLAVRLVRETLPLAGVPYVEALAAMARVHPFFEQAGLTRYDLPTPRQSHRLREALATAGLRREEARSGPALAAAVAALADEPLRHWIESELLRWVRSYLGAKTARTYRPTLDQTCGYAARFLYSDPAYFLWAKMSTGRKGNCIETQRVV